jgi:anti-sigma regulatory factor (Ser/Thr protein kinase)
MLLMARGLRRTWQVGTDHEVVSDSRHRISAHAADLPDAVAGDIELLASELVANAVLHGGGPVTVGLERTGHHVRVEVSDTSEDLPTLRAPEDLLAERGRGFLLVDRLASRWGFERRRDDGKTVWFEVEA